MTVSIQAVTWAEAADALLAIRHAVFVDEQGVPVELEHDQHDAAALHLLATLADGTPVGTARLLADGHIGRMAVIAPCRGRGIGSRLLRELLRHARDQGLIRVFLHAQCSAIPFYERHGLHAEGAVFDDAGIDHRRMVMNIASDEG
jgi:predicted GNAT family N-acyltransferase